ncbi:cytochrome P450 [Dendrothele bispora CBS 962.96]|uniref:Cytochrome P450 n=1 Tax=Dendrothele bispora (strain CBS 962.96) TaxID=1314807 RepID=A0A4S8MEP3_DENBC|nr:cytochrome P450 [Dendrothele bispora CBS 962.96]
MTEKLKSYLRRNAIDSVYILSFCYNVDNTFLCLAALVALQTGQGRTTLTEWAREYGDLYSLKIGPDTTIVVTSMKAVKELMEQQSGLTCDRPRSYILDILHEGYHAATMRYNERWRLLRKSMHSILTPDGVVAHQPVQVAEATQLMYDLLHSPEDFYTHVRRYSTSVITSIVFGKRFPQYNCPEVKGIFKSLSAGEAAAEYGAHPPVDQLPFLKYVPERWASWKRKAKLGNRLFCRNIFHLLSLCEDRIQCGEGNGCFLEDVIQNQEKYRLTRKMIGYLGGVLLDGGAHTTSAFLQSMILSLIAFPEAQKQAHEELDHVIGEDRAPRLEDFVNLPYCQALINETHRFCPVAPLGIPHAIFKDGQYRDYILPQGAVVFINVYVYEDPEIFNPGRYLQNEFGTKPGINVSDFRNNIVFGSGRRVCPGMHLANNSLALNVMNLLWAFEFSPAIDPKTGKPVPVDVFKYEKEFKATRVKRPSTITSFCNVDSNVLRCPTALAALQAGEDRPAFTKWAREYGDIYSLKIGPDTTVVITSMKAVKELIDQQSGLTCDRPRSYMMDVVYEDHYAVVMKYSERWRLLRKSMHSILTPSGAAEHQPIQAAESMQLMYDLLQSPEELYTHIRRYTTSVITSVVFGKRFPQYDCPEVRGIFESLAASVLATEYGAHPPVDQFPFLNYIPERWASWKQKAKWYNRVIFRIHFHLLSLCEERIQHGEENGCFLEDVIKNQEKYGLTRKMIGYLGGVLLDGGAHTTAAFLQSMILCLIAFPEAQKRAHEELDHVIGEDRAPRLDDFDNLPYCQALINETHRFRPVGPLGIPHVTLKEGQYRDYVLPQGTVVFINVWGIYHDPGAIEHGGLRRPKPKVLRRLKTGLNTNTFRRPNPHLEEHPL